MRASRGAPLLNGARTFQVVWCGQFVSMLGSGLLTFALGIWLLQRSGSVMLFALNGLFSTLPMILVAPVAGAIADRYDRRWVMITADCGSALVTGIVALLLAAGQLQVWIVYLASGALTIMDLVQAPAYAAAVPLLVPKGQLGRANGLISLGRSAGSILAPALAGWLVLTVGLQGIIIIDLATFVVAVGTMLAVRIPRPAESAEGRAAKGSLWREASAGWAYHLTRPGLRALLWFFTALNLIEGITEVLRLPMVLAVTSTGTTGGVMSAAGIGALAGSLAMSAWGGPRRRIWGVLGFTGLAGLSLVLVGLRPSLALITGAYLVRFACGPIFSASAQAILQSKVATDMQGRVMATYTAFRGVTRTMALLMAGALADRIVEPLMAADGALASSVGRVIGVGPGRGMALLISMFGVLVVLLSAGALLMPRLRRIEAELPDAVVITQGAAQGLTA